MSDQRQLFRLPAVRDRMRPTAAQLALMDLLALYEGELMMETISEAARPVLRRLIASGLVVVTMSDRGSDYRLTPVGRLVRGRS